MIRLLISYLDVVSVGGNKKKKTKTYVVIKCLNIFIIISNEAMNIKMVRTLSLNINNIVNSNPA